MKKKRNIFIILLCINILLGNVIFAQSENLVLYCTNKTDKAKVNIKKRLEQTKKYLENSESKTRNAQLLHFIANLYYCLEYPEDTVKYYLENAFLEDSNWLCRRTKSLSEDPAFANIGVYYASNFSANWWQMHCERCKRICGDCKLEKINVEEEADINPNKKINYQQKIFEIGVQDQSFRGKNIGNWSTQTIIDSINRVQIDSLYDLYGFPSKDNVSKKCQEYVWLVVHHSTNCEWTKKWIIRFIDAFRTDSLYPNFLKETIRRFFEPNQGYCKEGGENFIQLLKSRYPPKYGELFGYDNF